MGGNCKSWRSTVLRQRFRRLKWEVAVRGGARVGGSGKLTFDCQPSLNLNCDRPGTLGLISLQSFEGSIDSVWWAKSISFYGFYDKYMGTCCSRTAQSAPLAETAKNETLIIHRDALDGDSLCLLSTAGGKMKPWSTLQCERIGSISQMYFWRD